MQMRNTRTCRSVVRVCGHVISLFFYPSAAALSTPLIRRINDDPLDNDFAFRRVNGAGQELGAWRVGLLILESAPPDLKMSHFLNRTPNRRMTGVVRRDQVVDGERKLFVPIHRAQQVVGHVEIPIFVVPVGAQISLGVEEGLPPDQSWVPECTALLETTVGFYSE